MQALQQPHRRALAGAARTLEQSVLGSWMRSLDPTWSLRRPRARIVAIVDETADTRTFVFDVNRHWRGHRAGEYTVIGVEIDGVRHQRCYSLSSAPGTAPAITVKRVAGGLVSNWLHDRARIGDVLELSQAAGEFVLPPECPDKILLYTGGSGITPAMSILRDLCRRGSVGDVVFVHHARSRDAVIFSSELAELAASVPGLRLVLRLDDELAGHKPCDRGWLERAVADFADRPTWLCGPPGLMDAVLDIWRGAGAEANLTCERFVAGSSPVAAAEQATAGGATVRVSLMRSGRTIAVPANRPLLDSLERAGVAVPSGCRMGLCNTCRCHKRSGATRDCRTGELSTMPDRPIRLCVSTPQSDVELDV